MPLSLPSVPIMSEDSNSSAFDLPLSGIEATDLSSLLSQFEEVSQSLDGISTPPETEPEKEAPTPPVIKSKPAQFKAQQCKSPAITPPATPPPEVLARIRAKRKRKLAIMLPTMLPAKLSGQPTASKTVNGGTLPELNNNKPGKIHTQTPVDGNVNTDYYDHIPDHDYCVNSPKMSPKRDKSEFVLNPDLCNSVPQPLLGQEEIVIDAGDTSVLNSDIQTDASQPDLEEGEVPQSPVLPPVSSSMTTSSKPAQKVREVPSVSKVKDRSRRKYRKRDASPVEDNDRYFDKIPAYFTTLSKPVKPPKKDRLSERQSGIRREDFIERDSSPSRHDPSVYDKLPAYYSCFTNSTRYDSRNQSEDQYDLEDLDSYPCAKKPRRNRYSVSRSRSRSYSRSRSRSYSRSRSRHRSLCRRRSYSSASGSSSSSRSSSRSRSYSRSKSRSRSRSYSHSRSYSRSRSRGRSRSRCDSRHRNWSRSSYSRSRSRSRSWSRSSSAENRRQERKELREKEKARQIEERRIVYVGKIPDGHTRRELRRRFSRFGDIDEVSVHFREYGDNYGFVTYAYTCDAYAAIEKGNDIPGEKRFDLCFGGRRQFCDTDYADLDGKKEIDEELAPLPTGASLDFDQLLKQAKMQQKKKR